MIHSEKATMTPENRKACDSSPDSVICTVESNFSPFSSSADRSSFASDIVDHDSTTSEPFQHLAGHEVQDSCSGSDPVQDLNKPCKVDKYGKGDRARVNRTEDKDGGSLAIDSARSSFSVAVKDCKEKRLQSNAPPKEQDRHRKLSLDFGDNVTSISPRLEAMKRNSISRQPGAFPSPVTPTYRGTQKGWSSERVALHHNGNRRSGNSAFMLSFHNIDNTRRTLPSKWEDAERWIFSPRAGDAFVKPSAPPPQRRPKAKSGPLGPPGVAYHSMYSPAMVDAGNARSFMAGSPFTGGVIPSNGLAIQCGDHGRKTEPCMGRSVSLHGCSELMNQTSLPSSEDEKHDGIEDAATDVSRVASRRDMATQMSPDISPQSPLKRLPSTPSLMSIVEFQSSHSSKSDARDFDASERITVTSWSIKSRSRHSGKSSGNVHDWTKKAMDSWCSAWDVSDTAKSISKVQREEARISAWENLQKAKAEAAIRKLEMKLEKKRSSSMEKIINKLRAAQKRAQDMRNRVLATQVHQVTRTSRKAILFHRPRQISSLTGCFTCHAFESA